MIRSLKALFLWCALLAACGGVPLIARAGGPAGTTFTGAGSPLQAVMALVKPFYAAGYNHSACNAAQDKVAACPITRRLRSRLHPIQGEGGNPICRCQNPPRSVRLTLTRNTGRVAYVNARWIYGVSSYKSTFVVLHGGSGWLVDDVYCAGRPGTTIYRLPAGPCG